MARLFSATDAKRIIERHQNIIEKLNNSVSSVEKYRTKAKEASDALVAQELLMSLIRHRQEQFLWLKYNPGELD